MTTLLKGGTIITGAGQRRADLLLDGEKIAWMGRGPQTADQVVDVTGCFLFPGFIDAHTHFDLDVANTTTAVLPSSGTVTDWVVCHGSSAVESGV